MSIPEDVMDKLDSNPSWTVQHEDIVQAMHENNPGKPWSRYMIGQHLDSDPAKRTLLTRLDELVELGVLNSYEYGTGNKTLYELAYDPIVTDGGRLNNADLLDVAALRNPEAIRDLRTGAAFLTMVFLGIGLITEILDISIRVSSFNNFYINVAMTLLVIVLIIPPLMRTKEQLDEVLRA